MPTRQRLEARAAADEELDLHRASDSIAADYASGDARKMTRDLAARGAAAAAAAADVAGQGRDPGRLARPPRRRGWRPATRAWTPSSTSSARWELAALAERAGLLPHELVDIAEGAGRRCRTRSSGTAPGVRALGTGRRRGRGSCRRRPRR